MTNISIDQPSIFQIRVTEKHLFRVTEAEPVVVDLPLQIDLSFQSGSMSVASSPEGSGEC